MPYTPQALLKPVINGINTTLFDDGTATADGGATGNWSSQTAAKDNSLTVKIAGKISSVVDVDYTFDSNNQLNVAIPVQTGIVTAVPATPMSGRIVIADDGTLSYQLIAANDVPALVASSTATPTIKLASFYLYSTLSIDTAADQLDVVLNRTNVALKIAGDDNVQASKTLSSSGAQVDQFIFQASTQDADTTGARQPVPAAISFTGFWDLFNGRLVFSAQTVTASGSSIPGLKIAVGGSYKGFNGGLLAYVGPTGAMQVVMEVSGTHTWDNTNLTWTLNLGYTQGKSFDMKMTVKGAPVQSTADSTLTFGGSLEIAQSSPGAPLIIDFSLTATCTFKNGKLSITAEYKNQGYNLEVDGTFTGANYNITFDIKYTNSPGAQPVSFSFGSSFTDGGLKANLQLALGPQGLQANFSLTLSYPYDHTPPSTSGSGSGGAATPAPAPPAAAALAAVAPEAPAVAPVAPVRLQSIDTFHEVLYLGNHQTVLRPVPVFSLPGKPASYLFKAHMEIDGDGAPKCYYPNDDSVALDDLTNSTSDSRKYIQGTTGVGPAPGYYVSATYLQSGPDNDTGSYVDATQIPYMVLPKGWRDVGRGDLGMVIYWAKKNLPDNQVPVTHAIYADCNANVGEASIKAAQNLGLNNLTPRDGDDDDNYIYIVFPGTALTPAANPPHWPDAAIKTAATALFNQMGGIAAVRRLFS